MEKSNEAIEMKKTLIRNLLTTFILVICFSNIIHSQTETKNKYSGNYLSINPINMIFFQQIGITYEYKFEKIGVGLSPGYIYPNNKDYSNWFIAGPVSKASLGYYNGFYIIPHFNIYLSKPKSPKNNIQSFLSIKLVYKELKIDSSKVTVWIDYGDGDGAYRKMNDIAKIYGGFVDYGIRFNKKKLFIESNFGVGFLRTKHNMLIFEQGIRPYLMKKNEHPKESVDIEIVPAINFVITIGIRI